MRYVPYLTLAVLVALLGSSAINAEPDSVQGKAAAVEQAAGLHWQQAPTPELSEPAPQPTLVLPPEPVPVGEFIDVSVLAAVPAGVTPTLQWKIGGQPADAKNCRVASNGLSAVMTLPPGKHTVTVRGAWGVVEGGQVAITFVDLEGVIEVIGAQPPPVPPGPAPPVPPTPVVEGKRTVVILRESGDQTPAQGALFIGLRNGTAAQYIATKGHELKILDDEQLDAAGQRPKVIADILATNTPMPCIAIYDTGTGKLLHTQTLPPTVTPDGVVELIRQQGG